VDAGEPLLYRGTSSGWPGNPVLSSLRITPTSTDPLVATLFAIECQRFGKGIVLGCRRAAVERLVGPSNVLSAIESEVVIDVTPLEFVERFVEWIIGVDAARNALVEMGFEVPTFVGDKRVLDDWLSRSPRLDAAATAEFNRRVILEAAT
jgi:hypothetical protein